ncbi:MAG: RNA-binding domain-containing protein [Nitrososphaerota archaeon]|nr:hypothetical protein [Candidatus Geocrenenecus dongiae]
MRIERLLLQVLCHATEDEEKVMKAVENVVGDENMFKMSISSQQLKGYYSDPITMIKLELEDSETAIKIVKNILANISEYERKILIDEGLEKGKHGGKLYIRLDKQAAYRGFLRLSDKDAIRIQVDIRGNIEKFLKEVIG